MEIVLVGLNHRTAPVEVRERLAFNDSHAGEALKAFRERMNVEGVFLLSTCNRVELLAVRHASQDPPLRGAEMMATICELHGDDATISEDVLYEKHGEEAVRHIFRLAAGLDSMILGEPQILGQLRRSYAIASKCGTTGRYINKIFHRAFRTGKSVRSETELGHGGVSVASVAVTLAGKVFGNFTKHTALIVGAGEMAETAARHLKEKEIGKILFVNRSVEKAEVLANEFDGDALPFDHLLEGIERADVVISSTGAPGLILTHEQFHQVMDTRHTRPVFLVDIAVPRDIDPEINDHDNAFVYDIDSLQQVAEQNLDRRRAAIPAAEALVEREMASYLRWLEKLKVEPLVKQLHEHFDALRRCEVLKYKGRFCEKEEKDLEKLTHLIQKKLLHRPSEILRKCDSETEEGRMTIGIIRELFDLE